MIKHFTAYTINCVCHCIRSMFRVLGIYNFEQPQIYAYLAKINISLLKNAQFIIQVLPGIREDKPRTTKSDDASITPRFFNPIPIQGEDWSAKRKLCNPLYRSRSMAICVVKFPKEGYKIINFVSQIFTLFTFQSSKFNHYSSSQ